MIGRLLLGVMLAVVPPPFSEEFADLPDGPPPTSAPGGGTVENFAFFGEADPFVHDGALSVRDPLWAQAGSYRIAHLPREVTGVSATWSFSGWVVDGGALCLSVQQASISTSVPPVPLSPLHLVVTPTSWQVDVNAEDHTGVDNVARGDFAEPLPAHEPLTMSATLDRGRRQVTVALPDGTTHVLHDDRFALAGRYAYVEPFKLPSALTPFMTTPSVTRWSAW